MADGFRNRFQPSATLRRNGGNPPFPMAAVGPQRESKSRGFLRVSDGGFCIERGGSLRRSPSLLNATNSTRRADWVGKLGPEDADGQARRRPGASVINAGRVASGRWEAAQVQAVDRQGGSFLTVACSGKHTLGVFLISEFPKLFFVENDRSRYAEFRPGGVSHGPLRSLNSALPGPAARN
jgi:hypothetical protein